MTNPEGPTNPKPVPPIHDSLKNPPNEIEQIKNKAEVFWYRYSEEIILASVVGVGVLVVLSQKKNSREIAKRFKWMHERMAILETNVYNDLDLLVATLEVGPRATEPDLWGKYFPKK